jgi:hypothetical protein
MQDNALIHTVQKVHNISGNDNACEVLGKALREAWDALP